MTNLDTHQTASHSGQSSRPSAAGPVSPSLSPWLPLTSAEIHSVCTLDVGSKASFPVYDVGGDEGWLSLCPLGISNKMILSLIPQTVFT